MVERNTAIYGKLTHRQMVLGLERSDFDWLCGTPIELLKRNNRCITLSSRWFLVLEIGLCLSSISYVVCPIVLLVGSLDATFDEGPFPCVKRSANGVTVPCLFSVFSSIENIIAMIQTWQ
jgi:hypothetical protein